MPSITPMEGSSGVEADLAMVTRPSASTATRSVKVPPTSRPMRYMSAASARATAGAVAVLSGDEAVLQIGGPRGGIAPRGLAPAAAARRDDVENRPGRNGNTDLLGLEHASLALGHHHVAVGQAVLAAEDAVGGMAHAVSRGVASGGLGGLHAQPEHGADAAAELPIALGVGAELVALEEEGEARFRHLDAAELDPARGLALACRLPAVARRRGAAAAARVEEMPDERALRAWVLAGDGDAEASRPAGEGTLGAGAGQRLDHGLRDLLRAVVRRERHRRGRVRPRDGALLCLDLHGTEGALVLRDARVEEIGQGHMHGGHRVRVRRVHEADHLRVTLREIHDERVALFGHGGAERDVLDAVAVVVEDGHPAVDAVLPAADAGAALALGTVQYLAHCGHGGVDTVVVDQLEEAALAHSSRAEHGLEVAREVARMAHVGGDQLHHVVAQATCVVELERRNADALLPDLRGPGVVGAVGGAANVALVGAIDGPEGEALAHEHGQEGGEVREVIAAVVRIVEKEHVTGLDAPREVVGHGLDGHGQRAHVDGHVLGLRGESAFAVEDRGGEITARVEDLRVGGAQHRLAHLLHDGFETMLDHRDGDAIEGHDVPPASARDGEAWRDCTSVKGPRYTPRASAPARAHVASPSPVQRRRVHG